MSERQDGDRIIVTGYSGGSHFPRTQAATQFAFEANGLSPEGPFCIDGSVYGRDLRLRGPGEIAGPVLGRADVTLHNHGGKPQRLLGGLHASGNIAAVSRGQPLERSLVGRLAGADYVIRGDVIGEHVNLENAVVFGNVRGRQVRVTTSIVLGQLLATEAAHIVASTFLAYDAPRVHLEGPCCALYASGTSSSAPEWAPYRDGAGKSWRAEVMFRPALQVCGYEPLTNRPWETEAHAGARLHPSDWVRVDAERQISKLRDGKLETERQPTERHVLSVAARALNFGVLGEHLEKMKWMLKTALEFEHYHPRTQEELRRRWSAPGAADDRPLRDAHGCAVYPESCAADEIALLELATAAPRRG